MLKYDVTICGAGISGLLLASELSKSLSVVVVDRSPQAQCSPKFWLTTRQALDDNPELSDCIDSEWSKMDFISFDRTTFTAEGRYLLWNTTKLENYLIEAIAANGSTILYRHRFYSYKVSNTSIRAYANTSVFESRL